MPRKIDGLRSLNRRLFLISLGKVFGLGILLSRLVYLQVIQRKRYATLSDGNRIKLLITPSERGKIIGIGNKILALDTTYETLILEPRAMVNYAGVVALLAHILPLSTERKASLLKMKRRQSVILGDVIDWHKITEITNHIPDLRGIKIVALRKRSYPSGETCAHVVGYTRARDDVQLPSLNNGKIEVGATGIERSRDVLLSGRPGIIKVEVNAHGNLVREIDSDNSITGQDTVISIDHNLQQYTRELLRDLTGALVMIDNANGSVPVLYSSPSYNPNDITGGIHKDKWLQLTTDQRLPLFNRAILRLIPPGSTFKPVVAIAALSQNMIDKDSIFECNGLLRAGDRDFHCLSSHGRMDVQRALARSCNVFFYNLARNLDVDYATTIAHKLGLGIEANLGLFNDKNGFIPSTGWKLRKHRERWHYGDSMNYVIGQGYIACTPIQLAVMAARLATRKQIVPSLSLPVSRSFDELDIPDYALDVITGGMIQAMNAPYGTGYMASTTNKIDIIAGKTGTAQMISSRNSKDISLFIGFAPYSAPRYSICVMIENPTSRETKAAFIASKMLRYALI